MQQADGVTSTKDGNHVMSFRTNGSRFAAWNQTLPVDPGGTVVFFAINGERLLFDGQKGILYRSVPEYAERFLNALSAHDADQDMILADLKRQYGSACERLLSKIAAIRNGTARHLTEESRQSGFYRMYSPNIFNVYVSQGCNMACRYCFNQQGTFGGTASFMSDDVSKQSLEFIRKIALSERHAILSVNLFGGEPLLAPGAVYTLARGLQDLNHQNLKTKIRVMLSTNGTMYCKSIFEIIAERRDLCAVVVSLDSCKDIHDRNRPLGNRQNGSSYEAVLKNLGRMMQEQIPCSVTCVVPYPYDFIGACEELHRIGVESLEIKELINHIYGNVPLADCFERDFDAWRKNYLAYSDYHVQYLGTENPVRHVDRNALVNEYADALGGGGWFHGSLACGLVDSKIGITSDGTVMPCESFVGHPQFAIGHVSVGFDPTRYRQFSEWILAMGQHRIDNERCRKCYAKLICGGGCYAIAYDKKGELLPLDESACQYVREKVKIDLYYISRVKKEHPDRVAKATGAN